jgi:hypothetical protein
MAQSDALYAVIDDASIGNNTIVAAVAGKKIRVMGFFFVAAGAVDARWESDADGTALSGVMTLAAGDPFVASGFNPLGWFETVAGELLNLELSAAVSVDGALTYVLVD